MSELVDDLGEYFPGRELHTRQKPDMAISEQSQAFLRGCQQDLLQHVMPTACHVNKLDHWHFPLDSYDLDDIYNAANFVLCSEPLAGIVPASCYSTPTVFTPAPSDTTTVKTEAFTAAIESLGKGT